MDYFEQRIGRSANAVLVEIFEALCKRKHLTVLVPVGEAGVPINVSGIAAVTITTAGARELMEIMNRLRDELQAVNEADDALKRIRNRSKEPVLPTAPTVKRDDRPLEAKPLTRADWPELERQILTGEMTPIRAAATKVCNPDFAAWMKTRAASRKEV